MAGYCAHRTSQRNTFATYRRVDGVEVCRRCNKPVVVSTPSKTRDQALHADVPRGQRAFAISSAKVIATGSLGLMKIAFSLFGLFVIVVTIWGFDRAHSADFKVECVAYQAHETSMSFPDNLLCLTYWQLK